MIAARCKPHRDVNILIVVLRHQLREAQPAQYSNPAARNGRISGQSNDRHTHPQAVQGRGDSVTGERIQRHVDMMVKSKESDKALATGKFYPLTGNVVARKAGYYCG